LTVFGFPLLLLLIILAIFGPPRMRIAILIGFLIGGVGLMWALSLSSD